MQGVKKIVSFHKLIFKRIPFQVSSHFYSMFLTGQNLMFNVFVFTDIEMSFTGRENMFYVLEYAGSQSNRTVQHAFVIWTWHKKFKEEGCLCRRKGSEQPKTLGETVERDCMEILLGLNQGWPTFYFPCTNFVHL